MDTKLEIKRLKLIQTDPKIGSNQNELNQTTINVAYRVEQK